MSITADQLVSDALTLPPQVRAFVAERLIESLDATPGRQLSPAWIEEVRKRCREMDEGTVTLRDASAVFSKAYDALA